MHERKKMSGKGCRVREIGECKKGRGEGSRKKKKSTSWGSVCHCRLVVLGEVLIICRVVTGSRRGQRSASWPMGESVSHQSGLWKQVQKRAVISYKFMTHDT